MLRGMVSQKDFWVGGTFKSTVWLDDVIICLQIIRSRAQWTKKQFMEQQEDTGGDVWAN